MPRRVKSLKDATLYSMAKNISYWGDMIPEDPDSYLYLLSPFETLDHGLTQLLFDALVQNSSFIPKHIHLLFHSKLDAIDLSKCAAFKLGDNVLKTLLKRCKKIKNIRISGRTRFSRNLLSMIPLQYSKLQSITVTHESISDEFISNLVSSCKTLVSFQSATCTRLSNDSYIQLAHITGLQALTLGNADNLSNATLLCILKSCKKLRKLALPMTSADFKTFCNDDVFDTIKLLDLTLAENIDDESMERILASFQNLTGLCLSNCEKVTNKSLAIIASYRHLENLNISYSGIKRSSDKLKDLFMSIGHNLHSVDLSGISGIKTSLFGQFCSHLEKLYLNHCPYMETDWIPSNVMENITNQRSLQNHRALLYHKADKEQYSLLEMCPLLKTLQLNLGNKEAEFSVFELKAVLCGGTSLKSLGLIQIPQFSDADLIEVSSYMNMKQIRQLNVSGNRRITKHGVWFAIENMDDLEVIEIRNCDVIPNEINDLKKRINKKGYDVKILA